MAAQLDDILTMAWKSPWDNLKTLVTNQFEGDAETDDEAQTAAGRRQSRDLPQLQPPAAALFRHPGDTAAGVSHAINDRDTEVRGLQMALHDANQDRQRLQREDRPQGGHDSPATLRQHLMNRSYKTNCGVR